MKASTFLALIVAILCVAPRATSAQPYTTAAAGVGWNHIDCSSANLACEKTDIAFKLIGGYRVAPWIAAEAVYLDFGKGRQSNRFVEDTLKSSAFGGGVAFHGTAASWTVTARAGAAWAAAERTVQFGNLTPSSSTSNEVAPYGGVAIGYRFSRYAALAFGFDAMKSRWERSDGLGLEWIATAATAGVTIGR